MSMATELGKLVTYLAELLLVLLQLLITWPCEIKN